MNKVLLMGQSNVGKSVLFNCLSGGGATVSNYPGTTVDFDKGRMAIDGKIVEIIDVPGTFSLQPKDKAEEVALKMLEGEKDAVVLCVIDSSKIERGLYLALELIEKGCPVIIALNMADVAKDANIRINAEKLEDLLGVPVVTTVATMGEGLKKLVERMKETRSVKIEGIMKSVGGG